MDDLRSQVEAIRVGRVSPVELVHRTLDEAEDRGRELRAFITLDREGALSAAQEAERALGRGEQVGSLHGVPLHVKDLMRVRGLPMTGGSHALGNATPVGRDAPLVARLRHAGAIVFGTTNLNEFAYGITGANAHFGDVRNPWDPTRVSGGSSGGSGAAVAVGIGLGSVGTDTRGSIRIPASCCGITGFKPTRGLVPTSGIFPLSRTLDHAGPMARTAADAALLLAVIADRSWTAGPADAHRDTTAGLRIGLCPFFFRDVAPEVEGAVREAVEVLAGEGMSVRRVDVPELEGSLRASSVIAASEAIAVHDERIRARREDYDPSMLARLEKAYDLRALDLVRALRLRARMTAAYRRVFREVDVMVGPTLPGLPVSIGASTMQVGKDREEDLVDASCRLVAPQNMAGVPAISVPCGVSEGLPLGLQIWGARDADARVLAVAGAYQRASDWHLRRPSSHPAGPSTGTEAPTPGAAVRRAGDDRG